MTRKKLTDAQLQDRFLAPLGPAPDRMRGYMLLRDAILKAAVISVNCTPASTEQDRGLAALDHALWAFTAALTRN